jgi:hypothetical protein
MQQKMLMLAQFQHSCQAQQGQQAQGQREMRVSLQLLWAGGGCASSSQLASGG